MVYKFRFFLDWGSRIILWSGDSLTKVMFDYPVDHTQLVMSIDYVNRIEEVLKEYDDAFDPQEYVQTVKLKISDDEKNKLNSKIHKLAIDLQNELGKEYEIIDEYKDL